MVPWLSCAIVPTGNSTSWSTWARRDRRTARRLPGGQRPLDRGGRHRVPQRHSKENSVIKLTGLNKATDVTLKRGIIGSLDLYAWLDQIRNGDQAALRTVVIHLQSEDHSQNVQTWRLLRARIVKHTSGPFNAQGTDVAMEEMVLAYERLELE